MVHEGFKRKLAAILSADVEGYSRLMCEDEIRTIRTLKRYKDIIAGLIQQYNGRVVDAPGDNLLAEFASVVDAVQCAVEIQGELAGCNQDSSAECRMFFRIGVNLGDVVEEEGRIYGDGVNIAARMESLCEGGGVCISGTAFEHVENKLELKFEDLGEHEVKNIIKPVRVYRVSSGPKAAGHKVEPASINNMAFPLPDKPSIAVLAFDNMSGDPEQDYLSDGISENIITALSYIPELFVIARNSSFTYKGKPIKVQRVSEELGVRYVLEGSVMKSGNRVRITAQLIDALTGGHRWSGRYDRDLKDLFSLIDEITRAVTIALEVELIHGELARLRFGSTQNLEAWGYAVKGASIFSKFGKEDMTLARDLFEKAVEIDASYAYPVGMLAWTHKIDAQFGYSDSRDHSLKLSVELAKKSLAINDKSPLLHSLLSHIHMIQGDHDAAVEEGRIAIAIGPNVAEAYLLFGEILIFSGHFDEATKMCEKAMRLHPHAPLYFLGWLLVAYYWGGRYDESLSVAEQQIDKSRKAGFTLGVVWGLKGSIMVKIKLGKRNEARQDAEEILKIWPWYNLEYIRSIYFYKDPANTEHWIEGLRTAGIPEHAPSQ